MAVMRLARLSSDAEKVTRTTVDTIEVSRKLAASWKSPPFQREIRINQKVQALVEEVRRDGVIPGVLTLGVYDGDTYVVDGQHRLHAFMAADIDIVYADVRWHHFTSMGDMATEFVNINTSLVRLRPDDILKGLEQSNVHLQRIRRLCPYVGYDAIRRGANNSPVVSMSTLLRVWLGSRGDVPAVSHAATTLPAMLDVAETQKLIDYLQLCFEAWHRDVEYAKLWGSLNMILCAWLYRRIVLGEGYSSQMRSVRLKPEQFKRGLMSLSANGDYLDYLVGRNVGDRDRGPAYARIKTIFAARFTEEMGGRVHLPQPAWAHQGKTTR
jgi:hypothetical protein